MAAIQRLNKQNLTQGNLQRQKQEMKVPMCSLLFYAVTGFLIIYTNLLVESYSASINP